tara:strand:- start:364 stop:513 length:150 start_codon:yes stop_codon:yes gene_type:complete
MAKLRFDKSVFETRSKFKKTGQGSHRRTSLQMMNKSKRSSYKAYRGQGR